MEGDADKDDLRGAIIQDCKSLASNLESTKFTHILGEWNKCVDWLVTILEEPHDDLLQLLHRDVGGAMNHI